MTANNPHATCPIHHRPLITVAWCPACRGASGGKASSPAKTKASRANAAKPRPRTRLATGWEAYGPVRGSCGHGHRTEDRARVCAEADAARCQRLGGGAYSDRQPRAYGRPKDTAPRFCAVCGADVLGNDPHAVDCPAQA